MVKCMLGHICQSHARLPPDTTLSSDALSYKNFDRSRLPSPVRTDHSHTTDLRYCNAHTHDRWFILRRIGECDVVHAHDDFAAAFHALQHSWRWERKTHGFVGYLKI